MAEVKEMKRFKKVLGILELMSIIILLFFWGQGCDFKKLAEEEILFINSIESQDKNVKVDVASMKAPDLPEGKIEKVVIVGKQMCPFALLFKIMSQDKQAQMTERDKERLISLKVDKAILELTGGEFSCQELWEEKRLGIKSLKEVKIYLFISEENLTEMLQVKNSQIRELRFKPIQGEDVEPGMIQVWGKVEIGNRGLGGKILRLFGVRAVGFKGRARFIIDIEGKKVNLLIYEASANGIKRASFNELEQLQQKINPVISLEEFPFLISLKEVKVERMIDPQNPKEKRSYIVISSGKVMDELTNHLFPEFPEEAKLEKLKE